MQKTAAELLKLEVLEVFSLYEDSNVSLGNARGVLSKAQEIHERNGRRIKALISALSELGEDSPIKIGTNGSIYKQSTK